MRKKRTAETQLQKNLLEHGVDHLLPVGTMLHGEGIVYVDAQEVRTPYQLDAYAVIRKARVGGKIVNVKQMLTPPKGYQFKVQVVEGEVFT